ncbi:hypothetical protein JXL19_09645 [bacterium]|nr:hypothetical protein [bacterium]
MNGYKKSKDIVFAISAGAEYGLGHLMRCAVLAREAKRQGMDICFLLKGDDTANTILKKESPNVEILEWNNENFKSCIAKLVVFDTRLDIDQECTIVSKRDTKLVLLDRLTPETDAINLYILPVAHHDAVPETMNDRVLAGPEYVILSEVFLNPGPNVIDSKNKDTLLISIGGSDPFNTTSKVMDACHLLKDAFDNKKIQVIIGPSNSRAEYIKRKARSYVMDAITAPSQREYRGLLSKSFLVVVGFGIAVYEIAYLKIPGLYITHYKEDLDGANKLESMGLGWLVGYGPELSAEAIQNKCISVLSQPNILLNKKPRLTIDGKGASRVIERFVQLI